MSKNNQLTPAVKTIVVEAPAGAATTDLESDAVDMANFDGIRFVASMGTITAGAVTSLRVEGSPTGVGDWDAIEGAVVTIPDDGDDKVYIVEVYRPGARYVRAVLDRGTQNAVCNGIIAEQYLPRVYPVAAHASVGDQVIAVLPAMTSSLPTA